jgi:hypothetical protein
MNKTLHRELTKKSLYQSHIPLCTGPFKDGAILSDIVREMKPQLQDAAQDLLTPRPEAVAQLLRLARNL